MTSIAAASSRKSAPGDDPTAGVAFHRIGRITPRYRWWRPITGSVVVLAGAVFIVFSARQQMSDQVSDIPGFGRLTGIVVGFTVFALILPLVLAVTRWIGARPIGTLASVTGRLRLSWLGLCLLIASAVPITVFVGVALLVLVTAAVNPSPPSAGAGVPHVAPDAAQILMLSLPVLLVLVVVQSATEEVVTRGWFLQAVGGFSRGPWLGIGVQALVFTVMHGLDGTVWGYTDLIVYSIMMGWLTVSTGGIEAAIALHVAWNGFLLAGAVIGVALLSYEPADAFGGSIEGTPWQTTAVHLPVVAGYTVLIWWLARRRNAPEGSRSLRQPSTS